MLPTWLQEDTPVSVVLDGPNHSDLASTEATTEEPSKATTAAQTDVTSAEAFHKAATDLDTVRASTEALTTEVAAATGRSAAAETDITAAVAAATTAVAITDTTAAVAVATRTAVVEMDTRTEDLHVAAE
jgi:hypothetical protein